MHTNMGITSSNMTQMDLLEQYIHFYIDSIKVIRGQVFATDLSFEQWKRQPVEIKCRKRKSTIIYEVPIGKDPVEHAKSKLRAAHKNTDKGWSFEVMEPLSE